MLEEQHVEGHSSESELDSQTQQGAGAQEGCGDGNAESSGWGLFSWLPTLRADPNFYCAKELLAKDMSERQVLITGGNSGFGRVVAEQLATQGAHVTLAVRRISAGEAVAAEINAKGVKGKVSVAFCDLASLESVRSFATSFAAEHEALHILIENAAVCAQGNTPSVDGFEPHLATNHYGHVLLRHLLTPLLAATAPSRVVTVGSAVHDRLFTGEPTTLDLDAGASHLGWTTDPNIGGLEQWMAYARSKLCNVLSVVAAAPRLNAQNITIVSVHPGADTTTGLFRASPWSARIVGFFGRFAGVQTTWQSVQTILHCALADELVNGAFYSQFYQAKYRDGQTGGWPMESPNPLVAVREHVPRLIWNADFAKKLEVLSYEAVGLAPPDVSKGVVMEESAAGGG